MTPNEDKILDLVESLNGVAGNRVEIAEVLSLTTDEEVAVGRHRVEARRCVGDLTRERRGGARERLQLLLYPRFPVRVNTPRLPEA